MLCTKAERLKAVEEIKEEIKYQKRVEKEKAASK